MTILAHSHKLTSSKLDFTAHADAWIARLEAALSKTYPDVSLCLGTRSNDLGGTLIDLDTIGSGREHSSRFGLLVKQESERSQFSVVSDDPIDGSIIKTLSKAVQRACQLAAEEASDFEWSALLVQIPRMLSYPSRLECTLHIGKMTLRATDTDFTDLVYHYDSGNSMSSGYKMQVSRPIWVMGRTNASSMESATSRAGRELRRLCGLLAVAWDVPYEIAIAPMPRCDQGPPQYRTRPGIRLVQEASPVDNWQAHPQLRGTDGLWSQAEKAELTASLDMFLEGEYVRARHPSLSAVSYVAAIEAIANTLFTVDTCECCLSTPGATRKYKEAVRLVVSERVALRLDRVYGWRSTTVHQGSLHSTEVNWSRGWARMLDPRDSRNLTDAIPDLRNAARLLIARGLKDQLPKPRSLKVAERTEG
jgi:hypothetical protein